MARTPNRRRPARGWPALLLVAACAGHGESGSPLIEVGTGDVEVRHLLTGELAAERAEALVVPPSDDWNLQLRWLIEDGTEVAAGDRVAELDSGQVLVRLEERRTELLAAAEESARVDADARAALERAQAADEEARAALERAGIAAEVPAELLPEREFEQRRLELERCRAAQQKTELELLAAEQAGRSDREVSRLELERLRREVGDLERRREEFVLRAPRPGVAVVGQHPWEGRRLEAGDVVYPGSTVATIPDLDSLVVVASLPDVDDGRIAPGMAGDCVLDAFPEETIGCRVREISATAAEPARASLRRAFRTLIELDQIDVAKHRPGMSVRVEVRRASVRGVAMLARAAVERSVDGAWVATASGERRRIRLGVCDATACVVEDGLAPGDRVRASVAPGAGS
jgi:multidrug resistance efflux pump